jgi:hypothetical protein
MMPLFSIAGVSELGEIEIEGDVGQFLFTFGG